MSENINRCFVCGELLQGHSKRPPDPGEEMPIPAVDGGLVFRATGNYGSSIFDPAGYQHVEAVICDRCVYERQDRLVYYAGDGQSAPQFPFPDPPK